MAEEPNPIDPDTQEIIKRKAARLARKYVIPHSDREDAEQDLVVELLRRLPNFDPMQSDRAEFVRTIVKHAVADIVRFRLAAKRSRARPTSLDSLSSDSSVLGREDEELVRAGLAMDIQDLLQTLPAELQRVAELLQSESPTETARVLGVGRGTVYRRLREIREFCAKSDLRKYLSTSSDSLRADRVVT